MSLGEDNYDNSINNNYVYDQIEIGGGNGSIIIIGDGNAVQLPESWNNNQQIFVPNLITFSTDGKWVNIVLINSEIKVDDVVTEWEKLVFRIPSVEIGNYLIWFEQ